MGNLIMLLLANHSTIITIIQLLRQGIDTAPDIVERLKTEWGAIAKFLSEDRDPTPKEMEA